jgi:23S rRNA pseudouridine1911/1915/1917 synthase
LACGGGLFIAKNPPEEFECIVSAEHKGQRIDQFLSRLPAPALSRSQAHRLIASGKVRINREIPKPSYKIKFNDRIAVIIPPPPELTVKGENLPLDIVYEDEDIIVVNKPKGMVVHPAPGNYSGTLVNALLFHCGHLAALGAPLRPGIVHRLDKDTSGLMVAAKNDAAYHSLARQFKDRTVGKTYLALVHGVVKNNTGIIEARIGRHPVHRKKMAVSEAQKGREAFTHYRVIERFKHYSLVEVKIRTGRTHQIRVHMSHIGHPVVGDQTYGKKNDGLGVRSQLLHAQALKFIHPRTGQPVEYKVAPPGEMKEVLDALPN